MEQKLEMINCYYQTSFFNMKIDLYVDLDDLNIIQDGAMGLYYHEYIHFLQDISTKYGLMNISTITYFIQACAHHISNNTLGKEFDVPIKLEDLPPAENEDFGLLNLELKPIYMGSKFNTKHKQVSHLQYKIEDFSLDSGTLVQKVMGKFRDENAKTVEFEFGGNILTEGMAHMCEQYLFSDVMPKAPDYPYAIVEKLVEIIYPKAQNEKLLLIVLCDMSLMTYHPGLNFIRLLEHVRDTKLAEIAESFDELYAKGLEFLNYSNTDFDILADTVATELKKNFKTEEFDDIGNWISTLFESIKRLRKDIPTFIIDLVRFGKPKENQFFHFTHNALGSPLVLNADGAGTISLPFNFEPQNPDFNPGIFMAINQVLRTFYMDKPAPCKLIDYCTNSKQKHPDLVIDDNCRNSPWKKVMETKLCPVGQIWHHWALRDYSPKYPQ